MGSLSPGLSRHPGLMAGQKICVCVCAWRSDELCVFLRLAGACCVCSPLCANWTKKCLTSIGNVCVHAKNVCVVGVRMPDCYIRGNNHLYLIMLVTGLCLLVSHKINHCVSLTLLSLSSPPGTSSHTKYRAVSNEEERKEVLVQSEMQMATEDMSTSQSGTRTTSTCQFIHNKSNVTP